MTARLVKTRYVYAGKGMPQPFDMEDASLPRLPRTPPQVRLELESATVDVTPGWPMRLEFDIAIVEVIAKSLRESIMRISPDAASVAEPYLDNIAEHIINDLQVIAPRFGYAPKPKERR